MNNNPLAIPVADLEGSLESELSVSAAILELEPPDADIHICVTVSKCGKDALVKGRISSSFSIPCAACLDPAPVDIREPLNASMRIPAHGEIDLAGPVRDAFMEGMPMKATCASSCKGLCPACGKNLNNGTCSCVKPEERQKGSLGVALDEALDRKER